MGIRYKKPISFVRMPAAAKMLPCSSNVFFISLDIRQILSTEGSIVLKFCRSNRRKPCGAAKFSLV